MKMPHVTLAKRYLLFLIGLFINSLGVSLITKASLGTSPISSIPYVLSLNFPLSLGMFTVLFSLVLILLQLLILGRDFRLVDLLQIPVSFAFGYFIDACMALLTFFEPAAYHLQLFSLALGCLILGAGVYLEVLADVVMLPGEALVRAVVSRTKLEFGLSKVVFDAGMSVTAALLSLLFAGALDGVREGTIIAALLVGFIARQLGARLAWLPRALFSQETARAEEV